jgi:hypothetical protein
MPKVLHILYNCLCKQIFTTKSFPLKDDSATYDIGGCWISNTEHLGLKITIADLRISPGVLDRQIQKFQTRWYGVHVCSNVSQNMHTKYIQQFTRFSNDNQQD